MAEADKEKDSLYNRYTHTHTQVSPKYFLAWRTTSSHVVDLLQFYLNNFLCNLTFQYLFI